MPLPNSVLCSSVIKAFFIPKRGTEIDEDLLCQNMSKTRSNVCILTSTTTYNIEKKFNILTTRDEYILGYEIECFENLPMF